MSEQQIETADAAREVLVIETDTATCRVYEVRGCPGVFVVLTGGGAHLGGFRCDDPRESAIREEAELVIEEASAVAEL